MMEAIVLYFIKVSIGLSVAYIFYALFLRRLTFYGSNRLYLLVFPLTCFFLPMVDLDPLLQTHINEHAIILQNVPTVQSYIPVRDLAADDHHLLSIFISVVVAGSIICLIKVCMQMISFLRMKKNASIIHADGNIRIYTSPGNGSFTVGSNIYIDTSLQNIPGEFSRGCCSMN